MLRFVRHPAAVAAIAFAAATALPALPAPAALQTVVGSQLTVTGTPVSDCSAKAEAALNSVLDSSSSTPDKLQWLGYGPRDSSGGSTATATIHCYPVGDGYVASFICAAQIPPNPVSAQVICTKLAAGFPASKGGS